MKVSTPQKLPAWPYSMWHIIIISMYNNFTENHKYFMSKIFHAIIFHVKQVCLMSQSWDNVASTHDHLLTVHAHKP